MTFGSRNSFDETTKSGDAPSSRPVGAERLNKFFCEAMPSHPLRSSPFLLEGAYVRHSNRLVPFFSQVPESRGRKSTDPSLRSAGFVVSILCQTRTNERSHPL
jgi:hypothetical protein